MKDNIHDYVKRLCKKYKTNNPFEIAEMKNILIIKEELGSLDGYYNMPYRQKQIHINCNLSGSREKYACAHELGHALMHPKSNTVFLKSDTLLSVDKLETEADTFAMELLVPDDLIDEYKHYTTEQLARLTGYNEALIQMRVR